MPIEIRMPTLSPTMNEGTIAKWLKKVGDKVNPGDVIAEVETDKATMEVEAADSGTLGKIMVPEGSDGVAVNTVIALLLAEGEDASALAKVAPSATPTARPAAAAAAATSAPAPAPARTSGGNSATHPAPGGGRVPASPLARRMARQAGLELAALSGSGPGGRVVKADIEAALAGASSAPAPAAAAAAPPRMAPAADIRPAPFAPGAQVTEQPNSTMRKVIARRLTESKQTVPHFYVSIDCQIDALLRIRKELNQRLGDAGKISVNDFVIKGAALALRKVPAANASWSESATLLYGTVDISVAVAIPGGLITPIVRNADHKGLQAIAAEMKSLAERARAGKLLPEEYQGGSFSISNLGMYGVREFAAIINPPQACILAVAAGEQRPVVKDGALAIATVMTCTLSCDHRVVDGAVGAEYLAAFKRLLEDPLTMML
ncbi:MAG: pyruvate dehydrogenase complex dihydrolipoamide acetyltransferase [Alphaproteobacteria bacterium]|nr:pyruvate dehydrogenase complex dihydrolipoamide acetyltransferase [Alphaproteobacteria bacterium]